MSCAPPACPEPRLPDCAHWRGSAGQVDLPSSAYPRHVPLSAVKSTYRPVAPNAARRTGNGNGDMTLQESRPAAANPRTARSLLPIFRFIFSTLSVGEASSRPEGFAKSDWQPWKEPNSFGLVGWGTARWALGAAPGEGSPPRQRGAPTERKSIARTISRIHRPTSGLLR